MINRQSNMLNNKRQHRSSVWCIKYAGILSPPWNLIFLTKFYMYTTCRLIYLKKFKRFFQYMKSAGVFCSVMQVLHTYIHTENCVSFYRFILSYEFQEIRIQKRLSVIFWINGKKRGKP